MHEYKMDSVMIDSIRQTIAQNPFRSINKIISSELYQEILKGNILPEHRIVEAKLAQALGISRSPIKQALQDLEDQGVLVRENGNSLHVRSINYDICFEVYEARIALEPRAAYLAATRIRDNELEKLKKLVDWFVKIDDSRDQRAYTKADTEFHSIIIASARNQYISQMYETLEFPMACYRHQLDQLAYEDCHQKTGRPHGSGYHSHIYEMLKLHAPLLASDAMLCDVQRMFGTFSRLTK